MQQNYLSQFIFKSKAGFSIVECLFATALLAVTALSVSYSTLHSFSAAKRAIRHSIATQLALSKLEDLEAIDPSTLDSSDDSLEDDVVTGNVSFSREVAITVNDDSSRSVTVTVTPNNSSSSTAVTLESNFALWGNT